MILLVRGRFSNCYFETEDGVTFEKRDAVNRVYEIPTTMIRPGKDNVLTVRVKGYFKQGGLLRGTVYLDRFRQAFLDVLVEEYNQILFVILYLIVAVYFLLFFIRRPKSFENLFFGLFSLLLGIYFFARSDIRFLVINDFFIKKRIPCYI